MDAALSGLVDLLGRSGVVGTVIAGVIVGLVLAVILVGHFKGLWVDLQGRSQSVELQGKLLKLVETQQAAEEVLRRRLDLAEHGRDTAEEERDDLRVQCDLLRHQRRRLLDLTRQLVKRLPEPAIRRPAGETPA